MKSAPLVNAASSSNRKSPNRKSQIAKSQIIPLSFRRAPTLRNLFLLVTFATSVAAQNTSYKQDPTWRAPDQAATRKNPLAENKNAAAGGAKLFQRHCAECTAPSAQASKKPPTLQFPKSNPKPTAVSSGKSLMAIPTAVCHPSANFQNSSAGS